ncbi:MlaD family protein [Nocardia bovistercoris]|uniref:MCE family protein n=1 Tax=Nocardia bovistercoris TaxID=2785916 RepID=A0A931I7V7_9NOCA|nr:MCE family protein [Nocardia bovistercoris]MBH0775513.1 MCE family protein [Nocardia bovistercoris]
MKSLSAAIWRLALFAAAMIAVLALVLAAIARPVGGSTHTYRAVFTDANGLGAGDDVRLHGVGVGKVESIDLVGSDAVVRFTARTGVTLYESTRFAIRYQNMTGLRYIDVQQPESERGGELRADALVPKERTVASFDVTALFNGLKPVLATLRPEALNSFAESMIALIEGNGNGIGPALDAIGRLADYVGDRQRVISVLFDNLAQISDRIGGQSPGLVALLRRLADVFESLQVNMNGLLDFALTAPPVLYPLDNLLTTLGLTENENPDLDALLRKLFPDPQEAVDVLSRLPAVLAALNAALPNFAGSGPLCGKGEAVPPQALAVLLAGQKVTLCKG